MAPVDARRSPYLALPLVHVHIDASKASNRLSRLREPLHPHPDARRVRPRLGRPQLGHAGVVLDDTGPREAVPSVMGVGGSHGSIGCLVP